MKRFPSHSSRYQGAARKLDADASGEVPATDRGVGEAAGEVRVLTTCKLRNEMVYFLQVSFTKVTN
jgi:hypothetical protein